jgi:hypothetical protein
MNSNNLSGNTFTLFRFIFFFCSAYFLLMGIVLVFFPRFIVKGAGGTDVPPAVTDILPGRPKTTIKEVGIIDHRDKDPN